MKTILTFTFALAFCICSFAQMRFAVELSLNNNILKPALDQLTADNSATVGAKLVIEKPLSDQEYKAAFISSGIEISSYKNTVNYPLGLVDSTTSAFSIEAKALFVTIPITLKLRTTQYGLFTPFFQAGIEPTFVFKKDISGIPAALTEDKFEFGLEAFNFPFTFAGGTEVHISEENAAYASIFYKIGVSNLILDKYLEEGSAKPKGDSESMFLNNFGLRVGFLF